MVISDLNDFARIRGRMQWAIELEWLLIRYWCRVMERVTDISTIHSLCHQSHNKLMLATSACRLSITSHASCHVTGIGKHSGHCADTLSEPTAVVTSWMPYVCIPGTSDMRVCTRLSLLLCQLQCSQQKSQSPHHYDHAGYLCAALVQYFELPISFSLPGSALVMEDVL